MMACDLEYSGSKLFNELVSHCKKPSIDLRNDKVAKRLIENQLFERRAAALQIGIPIAFLCPISFVERLIPVTVAR